MTVKHETGSHDGGNEMLYHGAKGTISMAAKDSHDKVDTDETLRYSAKDEIPDPKTAKKLFAKELNSMTVTERDKVYHDIHGISQNVIEDAEVVSKCLYEMQLCVDKIREKPGYETAVSRHPNYVNSRKIRLMFLRSTDFDPSESAIRFIKWFDYKRLYFGDKVLGRSIQYSDLSEIDIACLKSGWIQVLPFRDKAGRAITWINHSARTHPSLEGNMRAAVYIMMRLLEDEETQINGVVHIGVGYGLEKIKMTPENRNFFWQLSHFNSNAPIRVMATHFHIHFQILYPIFALLQLGTTKENRARNRLHCGSLQEWMYSLMTFGIPVNYIPINDDGSAKVHGHLKFVSRLFESENNAILRNKNIIELPRHNDILLGRGTTIQQYSGNLWFHHFAGQFSAIYEDSPKGQKREVVKHVLTLIKKQERSRFLDRDKHGNWVEANDETALKKIAHRLRVKYPAQPVESISICQPPSFVSQTPEICLTECCHPSGGRDAKRMRVTSS